MKLRVLHIGNIANNAYNIANGLRRYTSIEADVFTHGYKHYISQPEWEDADIDSIQFSETRPPDWTKVDLNEFMRPNWYHEDFDLSLKRHMSSLQERDHLRKLIGNEQAVCELVRLIDSTEQSGVSSEDMFWTLRALYKGDTAFWPKTVVQSEWAQYLVDEFNRLLREKLSSISKPSIETCFERSWQLKQLFSYYDIIQAYGVWEPMYPLILTPGIPRVNFEHGSMREHPFAGDDVGNLLALSYHKSEWNIITNGDAIHAARRLGLEKFSFVPHPVDDQKFRPSVTGLRNSLLKEYDCTHILLNPSRQHWGLKGNDRLLKALAGVVKKTAFKPVLLLARWGQEINRTEKLIDSLGLDKFVTWIPPLPKRRLAEYINASDIVLDQFVLGCFGTTTPEGLACAKPVLVSYDYELHEWCFPEAPPVLHCSDPDEIEGQLTYLLCNPQKALEIGKASQVWFEKYHSLKTVIQKHLEIYERIQNAPTSVNIPWSSIALGNEEYVMKSVSIAALVRCRCPLTEDGEPLFLREVNGYTSMDVLERRLKMLPQMQNIYLIMDQAEERTAEKAKALGWTVFVRGKRSLAYFFSAANLMRFDYISVFDLAYPFVDIDNLKSMLMFTVDSNSSHALNDGEAIYCASRIVKPRILLKALLYKRLIAEQYVPWHNAIAQMLPHIEHTVYTVRPEVSTAITAHNYSASVVKALGGIDFSLIDVEKLEQENTFSRLDFHHAENASQDSDAVSAPKQMFKQVAAIIRCQSPLDAQGKPQYTLEKDKQCQLDRLDTSLRDNPMIGKVILLLDQPESNTEKKATELGWSVVVPSQKSFRDLYSLFTIASYKYLALFDVNLRELNSPAFNHVMWRVYSEEPLETKVSGGRGDNATWIFAREFGARVLLKKLFSPKRGQSWGQICRELWSDVHSLEVVMPSNTKEQNEARRQELFEQLRNADAPHIVNAELNELETSMKCERLLSFPVRVGINLTPVCNVRCKFCSYHPKHLKNKERLTLEQFKRLSWLRYVSKISLFAGIGESLANPEFEDILEYTSKTFPHLEVDFFTNGKALSEKLIDKLINFRVQAIHCSLNAATKETYDALIENGKFEHTVSMLKLLNERRKAAGQDVPKIGLSAVLVRENIEELPEFVKLASEINVEYVSACHYATTTTVGCRGLGQSSSLYLCKELADEMFVKAEKVAKDLGVNLMLPPKFSEPHSIFNGMRIQHVSYPLRCYEPWKNAYLTVDEEGIPQLIFCCSGVYYNVYFSRDELDEESFLKLWNHKVPRYFRRTVDKLKENPLCKHCFTQDRFALDDNLLDVNSQMQNIFEQISEDD